MKRSGTGGTPLVPKIFGRTTTAERSGSISRVGRNGRWLIRVAVVLVILAVGFAAGRNVVRSVTPEEAPQTPVLVEVVEETLGRVVKVGGEAEWPVVRSLKTRRGGIVTWVTQQVSANDGAVIATIDLRPVVVAEGEIPAFRDLGPGVKGQDVDQLQRFLVRLGITDFEPDGDYGSATVIAVKAWQLVLGAEETGTVALGDILWVPAATVSLRPAFGVEVDSVVASGDALFDQLGAQPVITLATSQDQANILPLDVPVRVLYGEWVWEGILGTGQHTDGGVNFPVVKPGGEAVCGDECGVLPRAGVSAVEIEMIAVPSTTGPAVPLAALVTGADGTTTVELDDGTIVTVDVLATADGLAVVSGLDVGDTVRLPKPGG
jgi:peptidoglycan hydrolase-like protein with peptidoglycan-binding domain